MSVATPVNTTYSKAVFRALCKHSKRAGITIQAAIRNAVFEKYSEEIDKENELIRKEQTL